MKIVLQYLTKSGCILCDQYIFFLKKIKTRYPAVHMEIINIDEDPLYHKYLMKVPVVLINNQLISEIKFDERKIREYIDHLNKN